MKKILILTASLFASSICYSGLKTDAVYFTVDGTTQTSAAFISGGSSTSPLGVFKNGVQVSSPTSQINFSGNYWDITLGGTSTGTVKLIGGNTNYIQVSNSLQSGATAYPEYLSVGSTNAVQETPLNVYSYHNGVSYAPILNIANTGNGGFSASSGGIGFSLKNNSLNNALFSGIYDSGKSLTAGSETGNLNLLVKNAGSFPVWPQIVIDPNKTTITNRLQGYSGLQLNTLGLFYNVGATEKVIWYHNSGDGTWTYNGDTFTLDRKINFLTGIQASSVTVPGSNGVGVTYGVTAGSVTVNNLTASQFVKTDANKRLSSQAQISLATDVTGTLSAVNFVSTAAYTVSTQTFSGQNTFTNTSNSFSGDGSGLLKISSLTATGVTAGSYTNTNLTVDAQGRITAASNGSAGGGGGIASMRVEDGGSFVVDTSTFDFTGAQFVVTNSGGEGLIALNTSSVTLYGPNIPAASISAGNLGSNVLVSSVSISAFYNQAQIRTNLGLAIGTNVQAWDADLDDLADGSLTGSKVGSGVPAANIASGSLGALVMASSLTATGVTAGSYLNANITVDATGRITSATTGVSSATAIEFIIDGSGTEIADGIKGDLEIPFACTLDRVTAIANESGSITVDIWKDTYANFPPTVADTITASAKPTITSGTKAQDTTLTGWTKSIAAGDILRFNVDAATTTTRVTISLKAFKQ